MSQRENWPDYAKGIAILLVVLCHTGNGIAAAKFAGVPFWWAFNDVCYTFMVPVFFFLSGWFTQKSSKPPRTRLVYLIATILFPYLLWATVQSSLMVLGENTNRPQSWQNILPQLLFGGPMQFWFLYALFFLLLFDLIVRQLSLRSGFRVLATLALIPILLPIVGFGCFYRTVIHGLFFEMGIYLASVSFPSFSRPARILAGIVGLGALIALCLAGYGYASPFRSIPALFGIASCIALSTLIPSTEKWRWLQTLGRLSLQIYCLHLIFGGGTRTVLLHLGYTSFYGHLFVGFLAGLLIPLLVALADEKWFGWGFRLPIPTFSPRSKKTGQPLPAG